jgi:hypothetical protein
MTSLGAYAGQRATADNHADIGSRNPLNEPAKHANQRQD